MCSVSTQLINDLQILLNKKIYKSITVSYYNGDCIDNNMLNFFYDNNIIFDNYDKKYFICDKGVRYFNFRVSSL